ncbi:hypothetical protein [Glycomyces sp. YM15]|uniref:hypothetical protein n=1 Tax=Glycomyces sp. YM15 TaxID=2800446 RepID=UPI0019659186|nr:hypothetical protein [Glycomyces sp. YM15]
MRNLPPERRAEARAAGRETVRVATRARLVRAVLAFLDGNGVHLTEDERERFNSCTDDARVESWLFMAPFVSSASELLAEE